MLVARVPIGTISGETNEKPKENRLPTRSNVATFHVMNTTVKFFNAQGDQVEVNFAPDLTESSSKGSRIPLFHEDLQRIEYLAIELEKLKERIGGSRWIIF
ncbi:14781_t:CDS:2, partial [Dentiscutata erythropus]